MDIYMRNNVHNNNNTAVCTYGAMWLCALAHLLVPRTLGIRDKSAPVNAHLHITI